VMLVTKARWKGELNLHT